MVTYGFFNSVYGDRKYDADQMSDFYTGIVTQGVFQHVDNGLEVTAGTGLTVSVNTGRAIIQNKWVKNDTPLVLELAPAPTTYDRFDIVVLKYDSNNRNVQIIVKTGTPVGTPVVPELVREGGIYEMCLAVIDVVAGATSVTVTDTRSDSSVCGWAAVAQATSGEVDQMLDDLKTGFNGLTYQTPAESVIANDGALYDQILLKNAAINTSNSPSGETEYNMSVSTGYWEWEQDGKIYSNSSDTKYLKSNKMFSGVALAVEVKKGYCFRVVVCHKGGGGSYNLSYESYADYEYRSNWAEYPRVFFIKTDTPDQVMLFNFYHYGENQNMTPEQFAQNFSIKIVDANAINEIVNAKKESPEGFEQIQVKMELGAYYDSFGRHWYPTGSVTDLIPCQNMMRICIRHKYYYNDGYLFVFYDESKDYLSYAEILFDTTDPIQYLQAVVPKGAAYVRCYSYTYNLDEFAVYGEFKKNTEITIENVTANSYIDKNNGQVVSSSGSCSTDYIDVEGYGQIAANVYNVEGVWYAFYDKDQNYINGGEYAALSDGKGLIAYIDIPALAKYFRTSIYDSVFSLSYVKLIPFKWTGSPYFGKYFSILGDSISSFNGFIPAGNAYWYPHGDVTKVTDLWWSKLLDFFHGKLLVDESWSGSKISGSDASAGCGTRCQNLGTESQDPDVIIVYMGTNDYDYNTPLGDYDGHDAIPSDTSTFSNAYAIALDKILTKYKHSEVWCCTLQPMERHGSTGFPEKNSLGLTPEDYNDVIRTIAHAMNCKVLEHSQCGITYYNMDQYFEDWGTSKEHPNKAGHTLIANHDKRFML